MKKTISFSLMAAAVLLVGAGCSTTTELEEEIVANVNATAQEQEEAAEEMLEEAQTAAEEMEKMMEEVEAMATDEMVSTFAADNTADLMAEEVEVEYTRIADLVDVSGGTATGTAKLGTNGAGESILMVDFDNLPELEEGYFYEGWLVDKDPFSFITTGATEVVDGQVVNLYSSNASLDQYDRYVLTLEPDDGDPAPAEHIVEEDFQEIE